MKAQINFNGQEKFDLTIGDETISWLSTLIYNKGFVYSEINFVFYNDEELLEINKNHLNHDFYTDIITFDNTIQNTISADIAISIERVKDNAKKNNINLLTELRRVMVHGILHCMGFNDKEEAERHIMRKEENKALELFHVEHNKS